MITPTQMTGIILAGGQSVRMEKDKALLPWGKGTLLTLAVDKLTPLCREIVIVGPRRELNRNVRWTDDRYLRKGPLAGLHAGLAEAKFGGAIVLACDMPGVSVQVLAEIVRLSPGVDVVIPVHAKGYEPLCAWYAREACLPVAEKLLEDGNCSLQDILPQVRVAHFELENHFPGLSAQKVFVNLNSPADYETFCEY